MLLCVVVEVDSAYTFCVTMASLVPINSAACCKSELFLLWWCLAFFFSRMQFKPLTSPEYMEDIHNWDVIYSWIFSLKVEDTDFCFFQFFQISTSDRSYVHFLSTFSVSFQVSFECVCSYIQKQINKAGQGQESRTKRLRLPFQRKKNHLFISRPITKGQFLHPPSMSPFSLQVTKQGWRCNSMM